MLTGALTYSATGAIGGLLPIVGEQAREGTLLAGSLVAGGVAPPSAAKLASASTEAAPPGCRSEAEGRRSHIWRSPRRRMADRGRVAVRLGWTAGMPCLRITAVGSGVRAWIRRRAVSPTVRELPPRDCPQSDRGCAQDGLLSGALDASPRDCRWLPRRRWCGQRVSGLSRLGVSILALGLAPTVAACGGPHPAPVTRAERSVTIRLEAAPPGVRAVCQRAANRLGYRVFCPTALPRGWYSELDCADCNGTFSITGWFPGPRGYHGVPGEPRTGHVNIWATRWSGIDGLFVGCPDGDRLGRVSLAKLPTAHWILCPPGSELDSGHLVLEWVTRRIYYGVSAHTDNEPNRRLLMEIAARLRPVAARGR